MNEVSPNSPTRTGVSCGKMTFGTTLKSLTQKRLIMDSRTDYKKFYKIFNQCPLTTYVYELIESKIHS